MFSLSSLLSKIGPLSQLSLTWQPRQPDLSSLLGLVCQSGQLSQLGLTWLLSLPGLLLSLSDLRPAWPAQPA